MPHRHLRLASSQDLLSRENLKEVLAVHGVVRWRCLDLREEIKARFGVEVSERHVGRLLKRLRFTRLTVRPRHPKADEATQLAFKKTSPRS